MSDKPIQRGDLAMVVRGCPYCGCGKGVGHVFVVRWVGLCVGETQCCGDESEAMCADETVDGDDAWNLSRLQRLDPPALKDDVPTAEELTV